jgi:hypothetical protein
MRWPTWQHALVLVLASLAVAVVLRRSRPTRVGDALIPAANEIAIIAALYGVWRLARQLPIATTSGATDRARWLDDVQHALHLPSELTLQTFVIDHELLGRAINYYYGLAHVPSVIIFLIWMFVRHRDQYPRWRNVLAITTAFCLLIRFVRVAPPRLLPDLGYVDLSSLYGMSVYGPVGTGVSDQFAAMPSIHVAWATVVSIGVVVASTSPWRWLFLAHLPVTMIVVSATGHHWWLDGLVAIGLVLVALWIDDIGRRWLNSRRDLAAPETMAAPEPNLTSTVR